VVVVAPTANRPESFDSVNRRCKRTRLGRTVVVVVVVVVVKAKHNR
jgi:hypothetical protein